MLTYRVYKAPFCQYGLDSENLPSLSIKSRNGQQHGASRTTTRNPMHLKIDKNSFNWEGVHLHKLRVLNPLHSLCRELNGLSSLAQG